VTTGQPTDTFVRSRAGYQSVNYSSYINVWVNNHYSGADWTDYGLVQPAPAMVSDMAAKKAAGYDVTAASMDIVGENVWSTPSVEALRCTTSVVPATVTWVNKPSTTTEGSADATSFVLDHNVWDVTDIVSYWQANDAATDMCTILLKDVVDGTRGAYRSAENSGTKPVFTIEYSSAPLDATKVTAVTTASASWHGDGLIESVNDTNAAGRGSLTLDWDPVEHATSYSIYLFDGNTYRSVGSTTATSWASAGKGIYPSDTQIAAMSAGYSSDPFKAPAGLDLRDDPMPLYAKTAGNVMDAIPAYLFKVVPADALAEAPLSTQPTVTVQFADRTRHAYEMPAYTTYGLGSVAGDDAEVLLNTGAFTLSSTDLAINSFGPPAALRRTYRSSSTATTTFGEGWRFNFEQSITNGPASSRIYTDEAGEQYRFNAAGTNVWSAPHSMVATLTWVPASSTYELLFKGGEKTAFDGTGRLIRETDRHNDSVTYTWNGSSGLTITAANSHVISVTFASGAITGATYQRGGVTRQVTYPTRYKVVRKLSDTQSATVDYGYDAYHHISTVSVPVFTPGGVNALWPFGTVTSGAGTCVEYPNGTTAAARNTTFTIDTSARTASVSRQARVDLDTSDTEVAETYQWDPTGRETVRGVPATSTQTREGTSTTDYSPIGSPRRSVTAAGVVTEAVTDWRGNELSSSDVQGDTTYSVYNATDDLVSTTDPREAVTSYTYNASGDVLTDRRQLNGTDWAQTTYDYTGDAHGRVQSETKSIDASHVAVTTYGNYGDFTQAGTEINVGVALSTTDTLPGNLVTARTFNGFGDVLTETDPAGSLVASTTYDASGRAVIEQDASGALTRHRYDVLGNDVETSRTAGAAWADWTSKTVDPTGLVLSEQSFITSAGVPTCFRTVTHLYNASGQEATSTASNEGTSRTAYDAKGDVSYQWATTASSMTLTSKATITDTDADGREESSIVTADSELGSAETTTAYAPGDDEVAATNPADAEATEYEYDKAGNQTAVEAPDDGGGTVREESAYDLGGRVISSVDASSDVVITNYDLLGRVTSTSLGTSQGPRITSTTYNVLGWVLTSTDADGIVTSHQYDKAGRGLKQIVHRGATPDQVTQHFFDASGNETKTIDPDGWITETTFDGFGRVIHRSEHKGVEPAIHDVLAAFDEAGRPIETSDTVAGTRTTYRYAHTTSDKTVVTRTPGETQSPVELSAAGLELRRYFESGSGSSVSTLSMNVDIRDDTNVPELWHYVSGGRGVNRLNAPDRAGRLSLQFALRKAYYYYDASSGRKIREEVGSGSVRKSAFTYTDEGRLLSVETSNQPTLTYAFNEGGDITRAGDTTLAYDSIGGTLTSSTAGASTTTYDFDSRGRRISQTSPSQTATYTWTDGDRLARYDLDRAPFGSVDVSATFAYDASGQRTMSVVATAGVVTTTSYTYEGLQLARLASASQGTTTTISYIFDEEGRPQALSVSMSDTSTIYTLPIWVNDRGDVCRVTDYDLDTYVNDWTYDPYGRPLTTSVASSSWVPLSVAQRIADLQPLRYAGYAYDTFSGLYYCSQRYYDPTTAQFISRDPALSDAEESSYQYTEGEPIGRTDSNGLWWTLSRLKWRFWSATAYKIINITPYTAINKFSEAAAWVTRVIIGEGLSRGILSAGNHMQKRLAGIGGPYPGAFKNMPVEVDSGDLWMLTVSDYAYLVSQKGRRGRSEFQYEVKYRLLCYDRKGRLYRIATRSQRQWVGTSVWRGPGLNPYPYIKIRPSGWRTPSEQAF